MLEVTALTLAELRELADWLGVEYTPPA